MAEFRKEIERDAPFVSSGSTSDFIIVPPGDRPLYCFARFSVLDVVAEATPSSENGAGNDGLKLSGPLLAGVDACAMTPAPFTESTNTGHSVLVSAGVMGNVDVAAPNGSSGQSSAASSGDQNSTPSDFDMTGKAFIYMPVFDTNETPTTVEERQKHVRGWVNSLIDTQQLLDGALSGHPELSVTLRTSMPNVTDSVIATAGTRHKAFSKTVSDSSGSTWSLEVAGEPPRSGMSQRAQSLVVLVLGFAASILLFTLFHVLVHSRRKALDLVAKRTSELEAQTFQLDQSEKRFRSLVQNSSDLTLVCDEKGVLAYVSPVCKGLLGVEETALQGSMMTSVVHADDVETITQLLESKVSETPHVTLRVGMGNGPLRTMDATVSGLRDDAAASGIVFNLRDITDRQQLELELRQAQKLEAVGQLAAGIAHELNTPIQFVGDNVRFLQGAFDDLMGVLDVTQPSDDSHDVKSGLPLGATPRPHIRPVLHHEAGRDGHGWVTAPSWLLASR